MQTEELKLTSYEPRRFTVDEYHAMTEAGVIGYDENLELLDGVVYEKYTAGQKRRYTADEYQQMLRAGILHEDDHTELLDGRIHVMTAIGSRHASCVKRLNILLTERFQDRALVSVQDPIRLPEASEPEPDLALLGPRNDFYAKAHPGPDDVLLLIEVADTSAHDDRQIKMPLYARHGIAEAWLIDLADGCVEAHRVPATGGHEHVTRLRGTQTMTPQAFPDAQLSVGDLLGS